MPIVCPSHIAALFLWAILHMALNSVKYDTLTRKAVKHFWATRGGAKNPEDNRQAVVGGKNLDGIAALIKEITICNGLKEEDIKVRKKDITLPGFFRPTKQWDMLVMHKGKLVAAFESKSHVGSFGNNANNRAEEVMGSAGDFWRASKAGAFKNSNPFLGYIMLLEDRDEVKKPVKSASPNFEVLKEFDGASYESRYKLLCEKLMKDNLYQGAAIILSSRGGGKRGIYRDYYLQDFISKYAAHVAKVAKAA